MRDPFVLLLEVVDKGFWNLIPWHLMVIEAIHVMLSLDLSNASGGNVIGLFLLFDKVKGIKEECS